MAHSFTLLKAEVKALQQANALKKRRANKRRANKRRKHIQLGGSLTIEEGDELVRSTQTQEEEGGDATQELEPKLQIHDGADTEPAQVLDPMNKWFMAGMFYGPKNYRWSIERQFLYLNPDYPDSIEFLDQCKVPTTSTV
ncbi:hypothetical protein GMDG_04238 [Pseudogymnoascus destructans 20631-21]|uniref:Uncharacterized protein n=1 Tax=Pseudogymnoascus destructans (strain ATCC MYA-4855 / 20631-21) TaxID=658429 RepID=L8G9L1_PSED2|nr:hypothetical protein GMDG_04238 [Pseudogymnoascus destructans 20631-21]